MNSITKQDSFAKRLWTKFYAVPHAAFMAFDKKIDGGISFFLKHYGKSKFMISMSKRAQVLGIEKLWLKSPKAFVYFFLFYLVRDTILYIILPIYFAGFLGD